MANLTQKEQLLLQDQKKHEELCIKKYTNYANQSVDEELKQLFLKHAQQEQQHLSTINSILNGQIPNTQQNNSSAQNLYQPTGQNGIANQNDADLCEDLLSTEKYVSSTYDTAIFEFRDHNIRQALNHIQKEEQEHGEELFKYLESKGMYNPQ